MQKQNKKTPMKQRGRHHCQIFLKTQLWNYLKYIDTLQILSTFFSIAVFQMINLISDFFKLSLRNVN